jgi:signal transduction histidine kinase
VRQTVVSVNHEINNPLSVMMLCADLLSRTGLEDETMRHHVEEIRAHAERIASFIKRLNQIQTLVLKDYLPGLVQMLDVERSTSAGAGPNAESEGQGVFATLNIKEDAPCRFMSP